MPTLGGDDLPPFEGSGTVSLAGNLTSSPDSLPPNSEVLPDDVSTACDCVEQAVNSIAAKILTPLVEQIETLNNDRRLFEASIIGTIDKLIDDAGPATAKCHQKVFGQLDGQLTEAYHYAGKCGLVYPSSEEVINGIQTGEFLATCTFHRVPGVYSECDKSSQPEVLPAPREVPESPKPINQGTLPDLGLPKPAEKKPDDAKPGLTLPNASTGNVAALSPTIGLTVPDTRGQSPTPISVPPVGNTVAQIGTKPLPYEDVPLKRPNSESPVMPQGGTKELFPSKQGKAIQLVDSSIPGLPKIDLATPEGIGNLWKSLSSLSVGKVSLRQSLGFGYYEPDGKRMPKWLYPIYEKLPGVVGDALWSSIDSVLQALDWFSAQGGELLGCNVPALIPTTILSAIGGLLARWVSPDLSRLFDPARQVAAIACPTGQITAEQADKLRLLNLIDYDSWVGYVTADNQHSVPHGLLVHADRARPNVSEVLTLWKRGAIKTEEYRSAMKGLGVFNATDRERFEALAEAFPGFDDVIRFVVRDVFNEKIVSQYGYDSGFAENFTGEAKRYADAQGISRELALNYWRAHWQVPSNTQLYEMVHRLRPGRVKPELVTTIDDAKALLKVNDVLPWAVDREIEIAYHPLTRTDLQRAFFIGKLSEEQLKEGYLDLGYNNRDAAILVEFTIGLKEQRDRRLSAELSPKQAIVSFAKAELSEADLEQILRDSGLRGSELNSYLRAAKNRRYWYMRKQKLKAVRKQYESGKLGVTEAHSEILKMGLAEADARDLIEVWDAESSASERNITAAKLCHWRELKLIGEAEQLQRLVALGYSRKDAQLIATECEQNLTERQIRKLQSVLAKMEREYAKKAEQQRKADLKAAKEKRGAVGGAAGALPLDNGQPVQP